MNVDDLTKMIRDGLDLAGKTAVPVVPPGTAITVLPAVVLAPSDNALGDGNRTLRYGFDITIVVPRSKQVTQYDALCDLEAITLRSLIPSAVRFEGPIVLAVTGGGDSGEPPAMSRIIPITFAADFNLS